MSLQRNYTGSSLNNTSMSSFGSADGLVPIALSGGPPMYTVTGNTNVTLTKPLTGSAIVTSPNANITLTLPAQPCSQCTFRIIAGDNTNTTNIVAPNANSISGPLLSNAAVIACAGANAIKINTAALLGDTLTFVSDGTRWLVWGLASGAAAWTVA